MRAHAHRALVVANIELAHHDPAREHAGQALTLFADIGDLPGQAQTYRTAAYARAIDCYRQATSLHYRLGDRHDQADTLIRLGETREAIGDHDAARDTWKQALEILTEIDHPDTDLLRDRLAAANGVQEARQPASDVGS